MDVEKAREIMNNRRSGAYNSEYKSICFRIEREASLGRNFVDIIEWSPQLSTETLREWFPGFKVKKKFLCDEWRISW